MDGRKRIAWNLRRLRTARGFSQEDLAGSAKVDRTYVSGIERGTFNPTIDLIERLSSALSVDLVDLLAVPAEGEEVPKPLRPGRRSGK